MELTDEFSVRMTAAEWNQLAAILGEGPFRIVAPLLQKIREQAAAQDPALAAPPAPPAGPPEKDAPPVRGNGKTTHP